MTKIYKLKQKILTLKSFQAKNKLKKNIWVGREQYGYYGGNTFITNTYFNRYINLQKLKI